jgi:hypothetical protein
MRFSWKTTSKNLVKDRRLRYVLCTLEPVSDRLASILPTGGADVAIHRGARRRAKRWALDAEIDLLGPIRGTGLAINASVGGLRVAVDMGVPVGEICTLRVRTAPDHQTVEHAKVVWAKAQPDGYLLGLEFVGAPEA